MSLINVEELAIGYDGNAVEKNISFHVEEGEYLCIVGENGSGKSTLMKTLLGLVEPLAGKISFGDGLKKNEIGYLPQQTQVQKDFPASVYEVVLSGCQAHLTRWPFYTSEDKKTAESYIDQLGIGNLKKKCYRELSGGQQQRVLLARALCATKKMILLDEPVAGLDPRVTAEMYALIKELNDKGTAVIMITHDVAAAIRYADIVLHIGDHIFFGSSDEYINSDAGSMFLQKPGVNEK